jgi:hypothetical protein
MVVGNQKIIHYNYPQQRAFIVSANTTAVIMGRAGGKDHGFVTPTILRNVKGMPRGATAFISPTFIKAKTDMIPALVKAMEKHGFYEDIDFWVFKEPRDSADKSKKKINFIKAFEHPRDAMYSIFFRNGHVIRVIGLDNKKTANGQSNDFLVLNEGRFIKFEDYISRVKPTNRGNEDTAFANLHYHHGSLITTDMPRSAASRWILDYEKEVDQEQIDLIVSFDHEQRQLIKQIGDDLISRDPKLSLQIKLDKEQLLAAMRDLFARGKLHEALEKRFRKELRRLDDILFELRRDAVFTLRASTLDNIDAVGVRFINEMHRDLSDAEFRASILNEEVSSTDEPFYSTFNAELHTYVDVNYAYVELFEDHADMTSPWRKDEDLDPSRALHVACDWNKKMTCCVIGQEFQRAAKISNERFVKDPQRIKHMCKAIDDYYRDYPTKLLVHHFDQTATGEDASREIPYYVEFRNEMNALGWAVEDHYIGPAPTHRSRNKLFLRVYANDDPNTKPCEINRTNCPNLIISLENAGSYQNLKGIQKDKKPEESKVIKAEHATHLTDAHDTWYIGVFQDRLGEGAYEPDFTM